MKKGYESLNEAGIQTSKSFGQAKVLFTHENVTYAFRISLDDLEALRKKEGQVITEVTVKD